MTVLRKQKTRALLVQGFTLVAVLGLLAAFAFTARHNLQAQGITSGFDFLERTTGWDIQFSLLEYSPRSTYLQALLVGFTNTVYVGLIGLFCATVIGVFVGLTRVSSNAVANLVGTTYVEIFRNVPLLLQGFLWYAVLTHLPSPRQAINVADLLFVSNRGVMLPSLEFGGGNAAWLALAIVLAVAGAWRLRRDARWQATRWHRWTWLLAGLAVVVAATVLLLTGREPGAALVSYPQLKGLRFVGGVVIKPEFSALVIAIAVFGGAYIGEIVRGGFLAVHRGQLEAAAALGLSAFQRNWLVRIPLALRAILPALTNQYVWLMKATTIGIAIGFPDYFMVVSTSITQSGQTIELLMLLMGGFLLINVTLGWVMNRINAAIAIKGSEAGK